MEQPSQEHHSFAWGTAWMLLSAATLSFSFLFLKINLLYFNYFFLIFLRFFLPFLLVIGIIAVKKQWIVIRTKHLRLQLARSGCVLVAQYAFAYYITKNTLLNATVLLNASPLFIPLIEWGFLKHRPGKSTIFGALLSFLGVILVLHPDTSLFTAMGAIGLLAALGQAGSQVLYGMKSRKESLIHSLFYLFGLTGIGSFFIYLFVDLKEPLIHLEMSAWLLVYLFLMSIFTLLNQYYRGLAYRSSSPSTLAPFFYFSVFVSAILDWLIYKNIPSFLSIIGTILIILGGLLKIFLRAHILKKTK